MGIWSCSSEEVCQIGIMPVKKKINHDDTGTEANHYLYQIYKMKDPHISRDIDKNIKQYTNYFNSKYEKVELIYFRHLFMAGL